MLVLLASTVVMTVHAADGIALLRVTEPKSREPMVFAPDRVFGPFDPGFEWTEMIPSWNLPSPLATIKLDVALDEPATNPRWYEFGTWTSVAEGLRQSSKDQKDELAEVQTDTLVVATPRRQIWIRLSLDEKPEAAEKAFPFLTLSFRNPKAAPAKEAPLEVAWGKVIEVPRRSQMSYEGGEVWCSPTCVSMMMAHWAKELKQPKLDKDVPEIVRSVFDPNWPGTGNWPFNTAYAGSLPGLRGYVARFGGVREIEDWIDADIPVVASVSSAMLKGKPAKEPNDGHLVVVVGFTRTGDPVFNDPGRSKEIRQVYKRADFERAWASSGNTVYLIYPKSKKPPENRLGHWVGDNQ